MRVNNSIFGVDIEQSGSKLFRDECPRSFSFLLFFFDSVADYLFQIMSFNHIHMDLIYLNMAQGALEDAQIRQFLVVDGRQLFA